MHFYTVFYIRHSYLNNKKEKHYWIQTDILLLFFICFHMMINNIVSGNCRIGIDSLSTTLNHLVHICTCFYCLKQCYYILICHQVILFFLFFCMIVYSVKWHTEKKTYCTLFHEKYFIFFMKDIFITDFPFFCCEILFSLEGSWTVMNLKNPSALVVGKCLQ